MLPLSICIICNLYFFISILSSYNNPTSYTQDPICLMIVSELKLFLTTKDREVSGLEIENVVKFLNNFILYSRPYSNRSPYVTKDREVSDLEVKSDPMKRNPRHP